MSLRNQLDDREAETRAPAAARLVGPGEAVESVGHELLREPWAVVCHVQLDEPVGSKASRESNRSGVVRKGVVDEVSEGLLRTNRVGVELEVAGLDEDGLAVISGRCPAR